MKVYSIVNVVYVETILYLSVRVSLRFSMVKHGQVWSGMDEPRTPFRAARDNRHN